MLMRLLVLNDTQAAAVRSIEPVTRQRVNKYKRDAELDPRLMDNKAAMVAAGPPYDTWGRRAAYYVLPLPLRTASDFARVSGYLLAMPDHTLDTDIIFLPPEE